MSQVESMRGAMRLTRTRPVINGWDGSPLPSHFFRSTCTNPRGRRFIPAFSPKGAKQGSPGRSPGLQKKTERSPEGAGQKASRPFRAHRIRAQKPRALPWATFSRPFGATERQGVLNPIMADGPDTRTLPDIDVEEKLKSAFARGWSVIVWNDPVNLMDYVVYVFKTVLKMNEKDASRHMWEVHQKGKSLVARETREKSELLVHRLRSFGLNATMEQETTS